MAQGMLGDLLGEHIVELRGRPRVWPWRYDRSGREFWQRPHHQLHTCGEMHWLASPAHESTTHARKERGREQTTSRELKENTRFSYDCRPLAQWQCMPPGGARQGPIAGYVLQSAAPAGPHAASDAATRQGLSTDTRSPNLRKPRIQPYFKAPAPGWYIELYIELERFV